MKFILINDIHLTTKNPVSRIDNFHDAIFEKLDQILKLAVKVKASAILIAGDIFNEKSWAKVPTRLIFEIWSWCLTVQSQGIQVIAIPGNHDLYQDRYDSLPHQPLGLLFLGGAMVDCSFKIHTIGNVDIVGIPYPAAKTLSSYQDLPKPVSEHSILLSHCFATVEGGEYYDETIIRYADLLNLPFTVFHFGHDHSDHGVSRIDQKWFVNVGALSRGSIATDNITRDVKCVLLDMDGVSPSLSQIKLNVKPAQEVFDIALHEQHKREKSKLEQFVDDLKQDLIDVVGPADFKDRLKMMDIPIKVKQRVHEYIEKAESETV